MRIQCDRGRSTSCSDSSQSSMQMSACFNVNNNYSRFSIRSFWHPITEDIIQDVLERRNESNNLHTHQYLHTTIFPCIYWLQYPTYSTNSSSMASVHFSLTINCVSKGMLVYLRHQRIVSGPNVTFGTKFPSMTSNWTRSHPASSNLLQSAPSLPKSAGNTEGMIYDGTTRQDIMRFGGNEMSKMHFKVKFVVFWNSLHRICVYLLALF